MTAPEDQTTTEDAGGRSGTHHDDQHEHLRQSVSTFETKNPPGLPSGAIILSEVRQTRINWISRGRIAAGKITDIQGDPGTGKSTVVTDWSARISTGRALPDGEPSGPRGVVFLQGEDGVDDTIVPRLMAAGADLSRIVVLGERSSGEAYVIPNDIALVEQAVRSIDAALLVIDPLMAFLDPRINAHRDQDVRRALRPLAAMAERADVAIAIIRHLNKAQGLPAMYRGGGSIGIIGAARFGLLVAIDPNNSEARVVANLKQNLGKKSASLAFKLVEVPGTDVARVEYLGSSRHTADSLLNVQVEAPPASKLDDASEWLRQFLGDGPKPADRVMEAAREVNISEATLRRAADLIGRIAKKDGFDAGGWSWSLRGADASDAKALTDPGRCSPSIVEEGDHRVAQTEGKLPEETGNGTNDLGAFPAMNALYGA